jgi:prepilin-type processing-associated H-X9-DG protein
VGRSGGRDVRCKAGQCRQRRYFNAKEGPGGGNRLYRFGSSHSGVITVAMCDGSVRTISFNIDQQTFFNLGRRKDGAALKLD